MKTLIVTSKINIVGTLWMPHCNAAMDKTLDENDVICLLDGNEEIDREDLENWLNLHCGDFSSITDFYADIELPNGKNQIINWQDEENEYIYNDCMHYNDDL